MSVEIAVDTDIRGQLQSRAIAAVADRRHGVVAARHLLAPASAAGPDAALSHRSAAALWGIRPTARPQIEVTAPRRSRHGIQVHQARLARDEVTVHDGIPVTTPARTLVDLAAVLRPDQLKQAVNEAEILRLPYPDLSRYKGRRGVSALRTRAEPVMTRSRLERDFIGFLDAHGLPTPLVNRPLNGREPDFRWPEQKLIAELDGFGTHGTRQAFEDDRARDRRLLIAGRRVIRITFRQLQEQPGTVAGDLAQLL
jgi:hypothetical protein